MTSPCTVAVGEARLETLLSGTGDPVILLPAGRVPSARWPPSHSTSPRRGVPWQSMCAVEG